MQRQVFQSFDKVKNEIDIYIDIIINMPKKVLTHGRFSRSILDKVHLIPVYSVDIALTMKMIIITGM